MKNSTISKTLFTHVKIILFVLLGLFSVSVSAQNCGVNSGVSQSVCVGEELVLHGAASGLFEQPDTNIVWTQVSGPSVIIESPNSLKTQILGAVGGETYTFRISTVCDDGLLVYQDVVNTVLPITTADAGADIEECPGVTC